MKKTLQIIFFSLLLSPFIAHAQFERFKDSVVQLYGIVMTADSLKAIPNVNVVVKGRDRGTQTSQAGVFSIVVMKGDTIEFSHISYKTKIFEIPRDLEGNQQSVIQLMIEDTSYLPVTIIKPRPTPQQFERDFVNADVPDDEIEIARQNTNAAKLRILQRTTPYDGGEAANYSLRQNNQKYYYSGQAPPQNILNPFAWNEFIKAWKRGDYKKKN
ncbi:MAG TPA: carboxypeptidase-like regulatory domain-containing protein [Parasegetibacter sp.]